MVSRSIVKSFGFALSGFSYALKSQRNFRIQTIIAIATVSLASMVNFSIIEWIILLLVICSVLCAELLNTTLESVVDLVSGDKISEKARFAKDVSATVVLLTAVFAVIIGLILFIPHLLEFL